MVRNINVKIGLCFRLSYEVVDWLTILRYPVNLSADWLLSNINRFKLSTAQLLDIGKSVSIGGPQTKGEVCDCELTKNMFLHSDLFKLCPKKNTASLSSSFTQLCFTISKILALRGNEVKIWININQSNNNIHNFNPHQTLLKYLRTFLIFLDILMILANGPIILDY